MAKTRPRYKSGPKKGKFMSNRAIAAARAAKKGKRRKPKRTGTKKRRARRSNVARRKTRRRRRRIGKYTSPEEKAKLMAAAIALGYGESQGYLQRIPGAATVGQGTKGYGALAIVTHIAAKKLKSKWLDRFSQASANIAGYKFGQANFQMQGMAGFGDAMDEDEARVAGIIE